MFFSPKQATTSFRPYLNPLNLFRTTAATVSSESPSPAEQSALRESNLDASTPLHHRSPLFSRKTRYQTIANNNNNNNNTHATHANTTNLRTNYRYVPASANPPRVLRTNSKTKIKGHHHHRRRHANASVLRVQIQTNNALRKERSFRILERHRSIRSEDHDTSGTSGSSEFRALAQEVKIAFASSKVPTTDEEQVFCQELEKLGLDYVKVATVMDPRRAEEVKAERENMLAMLENERMQFACVMKRKEEEKKEKEERKGKKRVREREERVRLDKDKRKAKEEIRRKKKARRSHEARMHAEREQKARLEEEERQVRLEEERRSREQERLARLEAERLVRLEEHRARVEARLREREAERHRLMRESEAAKIAAEKRAMQEAHTRQAAEQAARRAHVETQAHLQARMDEMARLELEAWVQATMDSRRRQEIEERFKEQEERLRAHVAEYMRVQAAFEAHSFQARRVVAEEEEAKYFCHAQQQQDLNERFNCYAEDILMRDPSYMTSVNGDVSMSSIPDPLSDPTPAPLNRSPSPHPYIPPPQPNTLEEWFALYDSRWQDIRSLASSSSLPPPKTHAPRPHSHSPTSPGPCSVS